MLMLCRWLVTALFALSIFAGPFPVRAADWLPISPEELRVTSEPKAPQPLPSTCIGRSIATNNGPSEANDQRIRILTQEGRQFCDIYIPYYGGPEGVRSIEARTIHPDGSILKFEGTIFDKSIAEKSGARLMAKTFTLPDVQVGSIIEYRYRATWAPVRLRLALGVERTCSPRSGNSRWRANQCLSMRHSLAAGMPPNIVRRATANRKIDARDSGRPRVREEEYMPPEKRSEIPGGLHIRRRCPARREGPRGFWQKFARGKFGGTSKNSLNQRRAMADALAQIVEPGDSEDTKLHKIYERTQRLRNLSFERAKSQQESDREKLKDAKDVADVWSRATATATRYRGCALHCCARRASRPIRSSCPHATRISSTPTS